VFVFEFCLVAVDEELSSLGQCPSSEILQAAADGAPARVSCPLPAVVLRPAEETDAPAVFPPEARRVRKIAQRQLDWPFAVVVGSDMSDAKGTREGPDSPTTWFGAREERHAPSKHVERPRRGRSPSDERMQDLSGPHAPKAPAVRLAEQRRWRTSDAAPSLSIRGAASRTAAAQRSD
jgi:hypothetical protein